MKGICFNFTPPTLKKYEKNGKKDWRIEYYYEEKRLQIKCNKWRENFKTDKEAEKYIKEYMLVLIDQLMNGVNPFSSTKQKTDIKLTTLIKSYIDYYKKPYDKIIENKNGTYSKIEYERTLKRLQNYDYVVKRILDFLKPYDYKAKDLNLQEAQNLLDSMQEKYQWKIDSTKKYLSIFKNSYQYGIDNKYCDENPFAKVKPSGHKRIRRAVSNEEWDLISQELYNNNYHFYVFCKIVLHLIRPAELERIQKKHINLTNMSIFITNDISKTKKERVIYIQKSFYEEFKCYLDRIDFSNLSEESFLFGKKFLPSDSDSIADVRVSAEWRKVCDKLELSKECELYGLRHKGITDMANAGIPLNVIKLQAGHNQTIMTAHYANHYNEQAIEFLQNA